MPSIEGIGRDIRYGLRVLGRSPAFSCVAVLSLALGIGANTAIFSLLDAVLLRMLPVQHPEELVLLRVQTTRGAGYSYSYPVYRGMRDENQTLAGLVAFCPVRLNASVNGQPEPVASAHLVTGNYFPVLGVTAAAGRTLTPEDDRVQGGHPVTVLSYGYWKRRFSSSPAVIGQTINLDGLPFTIIGVAAPEFFGTEVGSAPDFFLPMMMQAQVSPAEGPWLDNWYMPRLNLIGRLKPGVTIEQARANLDTLFHAHISALPIGRTPKAAAWLGQTLHLEPGNRGLSELRRQFSQPLWILMSVVGLVLLIACANVANLLLARATVRQKEIAVRLSLGAKRGRLIRQLLTESLVLALAGGLLGLLVASRGSHFLLALLGSGAGSPAVPLEVSQRVLLFTAGLSIATGILFGLIPALRATKTDLTPALKEVSSGLGHRKGGTLLGKLLVAGQVAASLLLLIGAGLFVRSLEKLMTIDLGFTRESVLVMRLEPRGSDHKNVPLSLSYTQLLTRIESMAGVRAASLSGFTPLTPSDIAIPVVVPASSDPDEDTEVHFTQIYPHYFAALGIPLISGRELDQADMGPASAPVAVINETMARVVFNHEDPLGRQFAYNYGGGGPPVRVVGIARDAKYKSLREASMPMAYLPYLQAKTGRGQMTLLVRSVGNQAGLADAVRREVQKFYPESPLAEVRTLAQQVDASLVQERLIASISGLFAILALGLASTGLYGILSYSVARRSNEIGIRMALGAGRGEVIRMVLGEELSMVLLGILAGVPASLAISRLISSRLFGITATDLNTYLGALALLLVTALLAGYLPARRAASVDPLLALRYE